MYVGVACWTNSQCVLHIIQLPYARDAFPVKEIHERQPLPPAFLTDPPPTDFSLADISYLASEHLMLENVRHIRLPIAGYLHILPQGYRGIIVRRVTCYDKLLPEDDSVVCLC